MKSLPALLASSFVFLSLQGAQAQTNIPLPPTSATPAPTAGMTPTIGSTPGTLAAAGAGEKSLMMPGNPMSVSFTNQTGKSVTAYWVDFNGLNQQIGTLFPNQAVQITTYPGHLTVFMADGKQVAKFRADSSGASPAFAIVGNNPGPSNQIPQQTLSIPSTQGGPANSGGQNRPLLANLANFIQGLTTPIPSNQVNGGSTNLASILNNLTNNSAGVSGSQANPAGNTTPANLSSLEQAILVETNRVRASNGLTPVAASGPAATLSRQHSDSMKASSLLTHNGAEVRAKSAAQSMGIPYTGFSENVAQNNLAGTDQATAQAVVNAWMNSSGHRANILDSRARHLGVGISVGAGGVFYATQLFLY